MNRDCLICGLSFPIPSVPSARDRKKYCSRNCSNKGNGLFTAKKRGDALRGRGLGKTYTKLNGRHEHRVVMEKFLGRSLRTDEIVHHIDENKKNNNIENLMLTNRSEHARIHMTKNRNGKIINA